MIDDKLNKPPRVGKTGGRTRFLALLLLVLLPCAALFVFFVAARPGLGPTGMGAQLQSPLALRTRKEEAPHQLAASPQILEPPIIDSLRPDPPDADGMEELRSKNDDLQREMRLLQAQVAQKTTLVEEMREECKSILEKIYKTGNDTVKQWKKEKLRLIRHITEQAMTQLIERFGPEPAKILIETSQGNMIAEMAPPSIMPVVTLHFLDQVETGFWNNMSFFRAESHVVQATDMRPDGSRLKSSRKTTRSIPFQEYSPDFPHHKYTLGIAGRPGGPDFYINMLENIKIHGPGGQGHNYNGDPEADSCFAKLVQGSEVADRMQKLPYESANGLHILIEPVRIISMQIVSGKAAVPLLPPKEDEDE